MMNKLVMKIIIFTLVCHVSSSLEAKKDRKSEPVRNVFTGFVFGAAQNAANYVVKVGGRSSNIVNVYCKNIKSSLGNPKWYARVDMPHGNVPYHHINVNKAITGVKDPHIPISEFTAKISGLTGEALEFINKIAPAAQIVLVGVDAVDVLGDYLNGETEEAARKIVTKTTIYTGASYGASAGAACFSLIFPGVGTLIGGVIGGAVGGFSGGIGGEMIADQLGI